MANNQLLDNRFINKSENIIKQFGEEYGLLGFCNYANSLSWQSRFNYLKIIKDFYNTVKKKPNELKLDDFTMFFNYRYKKSPSQQGVVYSALKKYTKYLFVSKRINENYMDLIDRPKLIESQETIKKRENGFLTKKEIKILIDNVKNGVGTQREDLMKTRNSLIIMLFLNTGMRLAAIWKLDVSDIDIKNHTLINTEKRGKVREFALSDEIIELLNKWLAERDVILKGKKEAALFISEKHNRLSYEAIGDMVKKYTACILGKNISPHKLRATYGTQIYEATKDIYFTQQAMGHSNPGTTQLYVRGQQKEIMNKSADIMRKLTT